MVTSTTVADTRIPSAADELAARAPTARMNVATHRNERVRCRCGIDAACTGLVAPRQWVARRPQFRCSRHATRSLRLRRRCKSCIGGRCSDGALRAVGERPVDAILALVVEGGISSQADLRGDPLTGKVRGADTGDDELGRKRPLRPVQQGGRGFRGVAVSPGRGMEAVHEIEYALPVDAHPPHTAVANQSTGLLVEDATVPEAVPLPMFCGITLRRLP